MIARESMATKKARGGNRGKKSPRPAGPQKVDAKKAKKPIATRSARAAARKRSATARRTMKVRGQKATLFAQALGRCAPGYEVLIHEPGKPGFIEITGPAEKGVPKGTRCRCLSLDKSSCKKHPSIIKVRTGHYIVGKTQRRAVWVPKVLVDKGIIKVKENAKFNRNKMNGKPLLNG